MATGSRDGRHRRALERHRSAAVLPPRGRQWSRRDPRHLGGAPAGGLEPAAVIVLRAQLADEPYFPKAFPFASFAEQVEVIEALERRRPAAVLAVVPDGRASDPIFEDPDLAFPYATIPASIAEPLLPGSRIRLRVEAALAEGDAVNVSVGSTLGPGRSSAPTSI